MTTNIERVLRDREGEFFTRSIIEYPAFLRDEALWVRSLKARLTDDLRLEDEEVARLALAITSVEVRDVAWSLMTRDDADLWIVLLKDVLERLPMGRLVVAPLGLLAFAAWLADDTDLSIEAIGYALDLDPMYRLAHLVRAAVMGGYPSRSWEAVDVDELPIFTKSK